MPIVWSNEYSIGLDEIDEQHQTLIQIINDFEKAIFHKNVPLIQTALNATETYTIQHFSVEEVLMGIFNYPKINEHKQQHSIFLNIIVKRKKELNKLDATKDLTLILEMAGSTKNMLGQWLLNHIKVSDKEYTAFFLELKNQNKHLY